MLVPPSSVYRHRLCAVGVGGGALPNAPTRGTVIDLTPTTSEELGAKLPVLAPLAHDVWASGTSAKSFDLNYLGGAQSKGGRAAREA